MNSTYTANVERGDRFWLVTVPEIGHTTQARSLREVEPMARDLITVMTGETVFELHVSVALPDSVSKHVARSKELRAHSAQAQSDAAAESRAAARELAAMGLTMRDIGSALGVSFQRAAQLATAKS